MNEGKLKKHWEQVEKDKIMKSWDTLCCELLCRGLTRKYNSLKERMGKFTVSK